jgi:hypothetical protein
MTPQLHTAPEGCQVQTFSTPRGEDSKKFLRPADHLARRAPALTARFRIPHPPFLFLA